MGYSNDVKKKLKSNYCSNLSEQFYIPVLMEAEKYQRTSGYFSTAGMDLYADGLEGLISNNGVVEFIVSKHVSESDYNKIIEGYNLFEEYKNMGISSNPNDLDDRTQSQLGNLAYLISIGKARVKIAFTCDGSLFHDKFGLIFSGEDTIFFTGSANETYGGIYNNYESISVDASWDTSDNVTNRIEDYTKRFERLWNNQEQNVRVFEVSSLTYEDISKYQEQIEKGDVSDLIVDTLESVKENEIGFIMHEGVVVRVDKSASNLTGHDRFLKPGRDLSVFFEYDNSHIKKTVSYIDIEKVIQTTEQRASKSNITVSVSDNVKEYLTRSRYSIQLYKVLGSVYKNEVEQFPVSKKASFEDFCKVVQSEVERKLLDNHLHAAYYEYEMARVANFSVPGAGKTAMILGVFAYVNRIQTLRTEYVDKLLVICPINAFNSWISEFELVFGDKKKLDVLNSQTSKDFEYDLNTSWKRSNLVILNYESLPTYADLLEKLIDSKTMLVFDEVHRIKNPIGKRAERALQISRAPQFKYVLTGTPLPNKYSDIYNILNILYSNEYNYYFGWDFKELENPNNRKIQEVNSKLYPFFWRTNKTDLGVPKADNDIVEIVPPSSEQSDLAEQIYFNEKSSLAKLIRLIQASTNPSLVNNSIDYNELMSFDDSGDIQGITEEEFNELLEVSCNSEIKNDSAQPKTYSLTNYRTPKFDRGIELVVSLVKQGKKVLVWGIFVDTLNKITTELRREGLQVNLVYGGTPKADRQGLIEQFSDGNVEVLVTNPQTLGESISLHKSVHDAVYFEYDFNLTFMLQSRDRIHRLGLPESQYTRYYYLQTRAEDIYSDKPGYIDEMIYSRLKKKEETMLRAIDSREIHVEYSTDEILEAIEIIDNERNRINKNKKK